MSVAHKARQERRGEAQIVDGRRNRACAQRERRGRVADGSRPLLKVGQKSSTERRLPPHSGLCLGPLKEEALICRSPVGRIACGLVEWDGHEIPCVFPCCLLLEHYLPVRIVPSYVGKVSGSLISVEQGWPA